MNVSDYNVSTIIYKAGEVLVICKDDNFNISGWHVLEADVPFPVAIGFLDNLDEYKFNEYNTLRKVQEIYKYYRIENLTQLFVMTAQCCKHEPNFMRLAYLRSKEYNLTRAIEYIERKANELDISL